MRYYNGEIDDDLPYVGELHYDEEPASSMTRTAT